MLCHQFIENRLQLTPISVTEVQRLVPTVSQWCPEPWQISRRDITEQLHHEDVRRHVLRPRRRLRGDLSFGLSLHARSQSGRRIGMSTDMDVLAHPLFTRCTLWDMTDSGLGHGPFEKQHTQRAREAAAPPRPPLSLWGVVGD
eukprot:Polyplicarium_translucidae@DN2446_c0_g1_i4.p1